MGALLKARGRPPDRILLYAWNPLAVVEVAGSGHNDVLAVALLVAATLAVARGRRLAGAAVLALSALAKIFPIALLPLFARRVRAAHLLAPPIIIAACYAPYLSAGGNLFRSARAYAERWRFNDSLFGVIEWAVGLAGIPESAKAFADARGLPSLYAQPHMIARAVAAAMAAGLLVGLFVWLRRPDASLERAIYIFTGAVILLGPTLHPWYLIWILPWLALFPSPAWIAISATIPLVYAGAAWARWVEFPVFYAILAGTWAWSAARRSGGDGVVELSRNGRQRA
jgi:uncharacterized membrane protein